MQIAVANGHLAELLGGANLSLAAHAKQVLKLAARVLRELLMTRALLPRLGLELCDRLVDRIGCMEQVRPRDLLLLAEPGLAGGPLLGHVEVAVLGELEGGACRYHAVIMP